MKMWWLYDLDDYEYQISDPLTTFTYHNRNHRCWDRKPWYCIFSYSWNIHSLRMEFLYHKKHTQLLPFYHRCWVQIPMTKVNQERSIKSFSQDFHWGFLHTMSIILAIGLGLDLRSSNFRPPTAQWDWLVKILVNHNLKVATEPDWFHEYEIKIEYQFKIAGW